jgi:hypothetical protein
LFVATASFGPLCLETDLTENRDLDACPHGISSPLYSFVVATCAGDELQSLVERFFDINRSLKRLEVVRSLCVLGQGTVTWGFRSADGPKPALFMSEDLKVPLFPAFLPAEVCESPLYAFIENLVLHLYHSVLGPEDIVSRYGPINRGVRVPTDPNVALPPDEG